MSLKEEDLDPTEVQRSFAEEVGDVVKESMENVISASMTYNHSKVGLWVNQIVEGCMKELLKFQMPRKYIVNCTIMQRNGAGLHTATACFWDSDNDNSFTHTVEHKTLICTCTVYGLSL
eukprot:NODE_10891_length_572_cov_145.169265_g10614_i0.p1 GENE.NODE_10891_length_572_cov_145.169265_g10614_i0~~NODE_10891_length_572_cov_145.169265_g10614_i0.p1  ORF type:complete len:119 (-),score=17.70 NODE_10891_length_572_cov_145.169265_g10614_i0:151-507(-)